MIQRKQTLFLLAVAIIATLLFFVPFLTFSHDDSSQSLSLKDAFKSLENNNVFYPLVLNVLVLFSSLAIIFIYKKRILQFKLTNLLVVLNVLITGLFFTLSFHPAGKEPIHYNIGAFLPFAGAFFAFLAARFIKKDEKLVRGADRIR